MPSFSDVQPASYSCSVFHSCPSYYVVTKQAVAVLKGDSQVAGVITFTQEKEGSPVTVSGDVSSENLFQVWFVADNCRSLASTPMPSVASTSSKSHYSPPYQGHISPAWPQLAKVPVRLA